MGDPEINPKLYGHFIFNQGWINKQWAKVSSINGVEKTDSLMPKNETGLLIPYTHIHTHTHTYTHTNFNGLQTYVRGEIIKILEENTGSNLWHQP